ncbi:hypothetical protein NUACC21_10570 [Scytonema sp. NUACC21]
MKRQYLASTLSVVALIASSGWTRAHAITFTPPPNNGAPSQATGGASRGRLFTPVSGKGTPSQATGGASRGRLFTPASGKGTPSQATGGGSRVGTYYLNPSTVGTEGLAGVIALLPQNFYGTTVSERPTILVYIPASNAEEAVFSLKDEAGKMQHQMIIPVAGQTGVIAVKLPPNAPALAVGKNYQWFLALKVDGQLSPSTPYVDGWIQRIQPSPELTAAMQQKDALQQAVALGTNGVWYDCVAKLAALHAKESTNPILAKQWEELLSSVSLTEVAKAPFVVSGK